MNAVRGRGAVVDATVAGIDDDKRARIAGCLDLGFQRAPAGCHSLRRPCIDRDGTHERLAVNSDEIKHEPSGVVVTGLDHDRLAGMGVEQFTRTLVARKCGNVLEEGSGPEHRVAAMFPPCAVTGPVLTIRKFTRRYSLDDLVAVGSLTAAAGT